MGSFIQFGCSRTPVISIQLALTILHTNDFHGRLTPEAADRIRNLKDSSAACLYFDSGDCIKSGNLAVPMRQEEAWGLLARARCDASVLGNRESHPVERLFLQKIEGCTHPLLAANMRRRDSSRPFPGTLSFEFDGVRIGVIGVMVPMVTDRMAGALVSAYLWDLPIPTALNLGAELREKCDCLIALTHIGLAEDEKLASYGVFDLILGGHTHSVLDPPIRIGRTAICQAGSHGKYVGRYVLDGGALVSSELIVL